MTRWIHNLDEAKQIGQELVAICHNPACRHRQLVDLASVIHHVGGAHSLVPVKGVVHFSERMRCPVCGDRGMFIWLTEPKYPEPLTSGFGNAVNMWDGKGVRLERLLAQTGNLFVGRAANQAAIDQYPGRRITLQEGVRVLEDSRLKAIRGGRR